MEQELQRARAQVRHLPYTFYTYGLSLYIFENKFEDLVLLFRACFTVVAIS